MPIFAGPMPPNIPVTSFPRPALSAPPAPQNWSAGNVGNVAAVQRPAALPRPKVRAQSPDEPAAGGRNFRAEPRPAPIQMPSPEELGVARVRPSNFDGADWRAAYEQLDKLGAMGVQREHLQGGNFRISCLLPTSDPECRHNISVEATSEVTALQLLLERSNDWARSNARR